MNISFDASSILRLAEELESTQEDLDNAVEDGLDALADRAAELKAEYIEETYSRPIPVDEDGNPKWERTGAWRDGQVVEVAPFERIVRTEGDAEAYEERLAELPTGADGINRTNNAGERAAEKLDSEAEDIFGEALEDSLRRRA